MLPSLMKKFRVRDTPGRLRPEMTGFICLSLKDQTKVKSL